MEALSESTSQNYCTLNLTFYIYFSRIKDVEMGSVWRWLHLTADEFPPDTSVCLLMVRESSPTDVFPVKNVFHRSEPYAMLLSVSEVCSDSMMNPPPPPFSASC